MPPTKQQLLLLLLLLLLWLGFGPLNTRKLVSVASLLPNQPNPPSDLQHAPVRPFELLLLFLLLLLPLLLTCRYWPALSSLRYSKLVFLFIRRRTKYKHLQNPGKLSAILIRRNFLLRGFSFNYHHL